MDGLQGLEELANLHCSNLEMQYLAGRNWTRARDAITQWLEVGASISMISKLWRQLACSNPRSKKQSIETMKSKSHTSEALFPYPCFSKRSATLTSCFEELSTIVVRRVGGVANCFTCSTKVVSSVKMRLIQHSHSSMTYMSLRDKISVLSLEGCSCLPSCCSWSLFHTVQWAR